MSEDIELLLCIAGVLAIIVGLVHSVLGEVLIFKRLRNGTVVPAVAPEPLLEKHVRILWATWHIASIFGWALGILLINVSMEGELGAMQFIQYTALAMFCSGVLVLIATRAKHPGWVGLCAVAVLCWVS